MGQSVPVRQHGLDGVTPNRLALCGHAMPVHVTRQGVALFTVLASQSSEENGQSGSWRHYFDCSHSESELFVSWFERRLFKENQ